MKLFSFRTITGGYVFYSVIYFTLVALFFTLTSGSSSLFENLALSACSQLNIICLCCIFWILLFTSSIIGMTWHYTQERKVKLNAFHTVFLLSGVVLFTIVF